MRSQQEVVREQLEQKAQQAAAFAKASGQAAHQTVAITWESAHSLGERLVLIGALAGLVSFFLPSLRGPFGSNISGWTLAKEVMRVYWMFPLSMIVCLFLTWLNLKAPPRSRAAASRWFLIIGAAWMWFWISNMSWEFFTLATGGYIAMASAAVILAGGWKLSQDALAALSLPGPIWPN